MVEVPESIAELASKLGAKEISTVKGEIYVINTDVLDAIVFGKEGRNILVAVPKGKYDLYYISQLLGGSYKKLTEIVPTR